MFFPALSQCFAMSEQFHIWRGPTWSQHWNPTKNADTAEQCESWFCDSFLFICLFAGRKKELWALFGWYWLWRTPNFIWVLASQCLLWTLSLFFWRCLIHMIYMLNGILVYWTETLWLVLKLRDQHGVISSVPFFCFISFMKLNPALLWFFILFILSYGHRRDYLNNCGIKPTWNK